MGQFEIGEMRYPILLYVKYLSYLAKLKLIKLILINVLNLIMGYLKGNRCPTDVTYGKQAYSPEFSIVDGQVRVSFLRANCKLKSTGECSEPGITMGAATYYVNIFLVILYPLPPLSASTYPLPPADVSIAQPPSFWKQILVQQWRQELCTCGVVS